MLSKPNECFGCALFTLGQGFSRPEGTGVNGVLIVGEAIGEAEAKAGLPFRPYAAAGHVLDRAIRKAGLRREEFVFWNMVACRPPNNKLEGQSYESGAIEHCSQHFRRILQSHKPRAILGLGNIPAKYLTGLAGPKCGISLLRGFVYDTRWGIPVIPSLHPAFIARGQGKFLPVLIRDLLYAVEIAKNGKPADQKNYIEHPSLADVRAWIGHVRAHPELPISYDIETDYSLKEPDESDVENKGRNIVQIQFSTKPGEAIVLPWLGEFIELAREVLALPNEKWGWNCWVFDDVILGEHGVKIAGISTDVMWAWHHLQPDLPRGLQFVTSFYGPEMSAWKHLSEAQPEFYGGNDVDAVQRIGQRVFADIDKAGIRRGYERHIVQLQPILKAMCARGFPVNREASAAFREEIVTQREKLDRDIQALVPVSLRQIKPKAGFKSNPRRVKEIAALYGVTLNKGREAILPAPFKATVHAELGLECRAFEDGIERFFERLPFLPSSGSQVLGYIREKGHRVPTKLKELGADGEPKETTGKEGLLRLYKQTKDEFYRKVIDHREIGKITSTYIDGWKLDGEGRVHSTFLYTPATGQLASRDPNIQNCLKGGALAHAFRKTIIPKEGHVLIEFDATAFHALTLGFVAKDISYMQLARLDIHSYLAGHLLKLEGRNTWLQLSIDDLAGRLGEIKRDHEFVRNKKAKPTILGYGFGLGASKLYDMNLESFSSKKEAQGVIDMLNGLFPKTAKFREDTKELASKQGFLLSRHGYLRRFADIYGYRQVYEKHEPEPGEVLFVGRNGKRYKRVSGEEGESAIAFLPANSAFGEIKDKMLLLEEAGFNEKYRLINQIHDSLVMEVPRKLVDNCIADVSEVLERPSMVLIDPDVAPGGLRCGWEAMVGNNWAEMACVYKTSLSVLFNE